jgi:hypothetical protein
MANFLFRKKRSISASWNVAHMNLRPTVIDEKDIDSQHDLAMLMLDGFVYVILV